MSRCLPSGSLGSGAPSDGLEVLGARDGVPRWLPSPGTAAQPGMAEPRARPTPGRQLTYGSEGWHSLGPVESRRRGQGVRCRPARLHGSAAGGPCSHRGRWLRRWDAQQARGSRLRPASQTWGVGSGTVTVRVLEVTLGAGLGVNLAYPPCSPAGLWPALAAPGNTVLTRP